MKSVTVNPTWNVPPSIIYNEYMPALARDPTVLARMGLNVSYALDGSIHVSQPPGGASALGGFVSTSPTDSWYTSMTRMSGSCLRVRCGPTATAACVFRILRSMPKRSLQISLERLFFEERRRLKIIPNAFGERAVLKPMFGALIRVPSDGSRSRSPSLDVGRSPPSEQSSITNTRPKSVSEHNPQRMRSRRKYPAILGLDHVPVLNTAAIDIRASNLAIDIDAFRKRTARPERA